MSLYHVVLIAIFAAAAAAFVTLLLLDAPYGRFVREGWGVALSSRWAWFIMEFPAALSIFVVALRGDHGDVLSLLFLVIWEVHYLYRSLLYPALMRDPRTCTMPLVLIAIAVLYNCANGFVNGYHLFHRSVTYTSAWLTDPRFIAGMALFAAGMATHVWSDRILQRLRTPGEHDYRIPHGGPFRYVSSPNYAGEMFQWCGFALATWSLAGLSFAVFTIANLLPRALATHRWYRETFDDYPVDRKAVLPGIL